MKKAGMLLVGVIALISLEGCMTDRGEQLTKIRGSEQEMSDQIMQEIAEALDAGDADALKDVFSKPALKEAEDLNQQIADLMDFYQGKMVSYEGDASSSTSNHYGDKITEFTGYYQLITTEETYRVGYDHKPVDDENPEEIGLRRLELVTEDVYQEQVEDHGYYDWEYYENSPGVYMQGE